MWLVAHGRPATGERLKSKGGDRLKKKIESSGALLKKENPFSFGYSSSVRSDNVSVQAVDCLSMYLLPVARAKCRSSSGTLWHRRQIPFPRRSGGG